MRWLWPFGHTHATGTSNSVAAVPTSGPVQRTHAAPVLAATPPAIPPIQLTLSEAVATTQRMPEALTTSTNPTLMQRMRATVTEGLNPSTLPEQGMLHVSTAARRWSGAPIVARSAQAPRESRSRPVLASTSTSLPQSLAVHSPVSEFPATEAVDDVSPRMLDAVLGDADPIVVGRLVESPRPPVLATVIEHPAPQHPHVQRPQLQRHADSEIAPPTEEAVELPTSPRSSAPASAPAGIGQRTAADPAPTVQRAVAESVAAQRSTRGRTHVDAATTNSAPQANSPSRPSSTRPPQTVSVSRRLPDLPREPAPPTTSATESGARAEPDRPSAVHPDPVGPHVLRMETPPQTTVHEAAQPQATVHESTAHMTTAHEATVDEVTAPLVTVSRMSAAPVTASRTLTPPMTGPQGVVRREPDHRVTAPRHAVHPLQRSVESVVPEQLPRSVATPRTLSETVTNPSMDTFAGTPAIRVASEPTTSRGRVIHRLADSSVAQPFTPSPAGEAWNAPSTPQVTSVGGLSSRTAASPVQLARGAASTVAAVTPTLPALNVIRAESLSGQRVQRMGVGRPFSVHTDNAISPSSSSITGAEVSAQSPTVTSSAPVSFAEMFAAPTLPSSNLPVRTQPAATPPEPNPPGPMPIQRQALPTERNVGEPSSIVKSEIADPHRSLDALRAHAVVSRSVPSTQIAEPSGRSGAGTSAPSDTPASSHSTRAASDDVEELARRLYEPIAQRLRTELWLDRERAGFLTDH